MNIQSSKTVLIGFLIITFATIAAYCDIQNQQFLHWDDNFYVDGTKNIKSLTWDNIFWMFTSYSTANWHPITWLSYAFNYHFWGKEALVFKITNLFIHLLTTFLVFALTRKIINISHRSGNENSQFAIFAALFSAFLFSIHPQHVESVVWISGRKDLLCTLFYLSGIYAYLKQNEQPDTHKWNHITLFLFVLALMSKSMAVTFPVILLLLDFYPLQKVSLKDNLWSTIKILFNGKIHYFLISVTVGSITLITQSNEMQSLTSFTIWERIINASNNVIHYLQTIFYPFNIQAYYPLDTKSDSYVYLGLLAFITVLALFAISLLLWRQGKKQYLTALLFYIITLIPVIGIIKVGHAATADRYAYLPTISIYMLIGTAISYIYFLQKKRLLKVATTGIASCVIVLFGTYTYINSQNWRNDLVLWLSVTEAFPDKVEVAHNNLGGVYFKMKQYGNAIEQFNKALAIHPNVIGSFENIASSYIKIGRPEVALEYYKKSVELNPDVASPLITLGDFYRSNNEITLAVEHYRRAFDIAPQSPPVLLRNAYIDYLDNKLEDAMYKLSFLEKLNPDNVGGLQLQAQIKLMEEDYMEAEKLALRILSIRPKDNLALEILESAKNKTSPNA